MFGPEPGTPKEKRALSKWMKNHKGEGHIVFTHSHSTGIGPTFYVGCTRCGVAKDLTDYDSW
jgi:hypothetical protein